jgi:hypothetical protein
MRQCDECEQLSRHPVRPDVPTRFEQTQASDISSGFIRFVYQCKCCGDSWAWDSNEGWQQAVRSVTSVAPRQAFAQLDMVAA